MADQKVPCGCGCSLSKQQTGSVITMQMGVNALVKNILREIGIRPERFSLQWASAAEALRFVKLITQFTTEIKDLGPLGRAEAKAR